MLRNSVLFFALLLTTGCGYRFGYQGLDHVEICVPYVEGDLDGSLTAEIAHQLSCRSSFLYSPCGGDVSLRVCLLEPKIENIGFRYAPDKNGKPSKIMTSTEARLMIRAKVSLIDLRHGKCLLGPSEVFASIDYDFESDFSNLNFHTFSLGQLEMHQQASDNAFARLNVLLAQKIVDYVEGSW